MTEPVRLTFRDLRVRAVNVPMRLPLQTSGGRVDVAPLALIDLFTEEGVTGTAYLFCYTPLALRPVVQLLENLAPLLKGDRVAPLDIERKLQRQFRLLGPTGIAAMAMAGIDMAAWDALARARQLPLVELLGGAARPLNAYNSCGLGIIGSSRAANEASELVAPGFRALKIRLGYPDLKSDLDVVRAVRRAVGDSVELMVDYNQSLSAPEALRRASALADEGLYWLEEPTLADDAAGHARIREKSGLPLQLGENWWGPREMARSLALGASDLAMPDAMKIGGVTGWMRAAALAESAGMPMSSHLFPEISAHLLAVTPTCDRLEYVDWANPVLQQPLRIEGGCAVLRDEPGCGLAWDEEAVYRYLAE